MNRQYFEAILQLRNDKSRSFRDALDKIYSETEAKGRQDIFITKMEKVKGGVDAYMSSKKFTRDLGKKLNELYGGDLIQSPRLFSRNRQTSKDIYRLNVLVRLPAIELGSVVSQGRDLILITGYSKGRLHGRNLDTDKPVRLDDDGKLEVVAGPECQTVVVSRQKPRLEVLHPESFESVPVENATQTSKKKLRVILANGKIYEIV